MSPLLALGTRPSVAGNPADGRSIAIASDAQRLPPTKRAHVQRLLDMEPTGIEPVTSCLQNGTAGVPEGPDYLGIAGEVLLQAAHGYRWIRRD
jgi:hypothetical protein